MSHQTAPFLPAACTRCGAIFRSRLLSGLIVTKLVIGPGVPEQCPVCGGPATTAEGVFNYTDHAIEVLAAPDVTLEMLRALRAVLQRAHAQNLSPDETRRLAEAVSPRFGKLFEPWKWSDSVRVAWIHALGAVISAIIIARAGGITVNINTVQTIDAGKLLSAAEGRAVAEILAGDEWLQPSPEPMPVPEAPGDEETGAASSSAEPPPERRKPP